MGSFHWLLVRLIVVGACLLYGFLAIQAGQIIAARGLDGLCSMEVVQEFHEMFCSGILIPPGLSESYFCTKYVPKCPYTVWGVETALEGGLDLGRVSNEIQPSVPQALTTVSPPNAPARTPQNHGLSEDSISERLHRQYTILGSLIRSAAAIPTIIAGIQEIVSMTERMLVDTSGVGHGEAHGGLGNDKRINRKLQEIQKTALLSIKRLQAYSDRLDISLQL